MTRLEMLIELLRINPEKRSLNEVLLIKEELKEVEYFKKLILGDDFLIACKYIELLELKDRQVLFRKGEESKAAYIVLEGNIDVYLSNVTEDLLPKCYGSKGVVTTMQQGQLFGEIGLVGSEDGTRTATCVAKKRTILAVIPK